MKGTSYRQKLNLQQPANLPMPIGRAYFGEEIAALRRRNAKLRALAASEQHKAIAAEARDAATPRSCATRPSLRLARVRPLWVVAVTVEGKYCTE